MTRLAPALAAALLAAPPAQAQELPVATVTVLIETVPVENDPDDPAIWINRAHPLSSLVYGTDKQYGLLVFDLLGNVVQRLPDGQLNNVDLRQDVPIGGEARTLVAATKREDNTIVFYLADEAGLLSRATPFAFPGSPEPVRDDIYGLGFYQGRDGTLSVIVNFKTGDVFQWLVEAPDGELSLTLARRWTVPSQPEGIVADDSLGFIYVGEEDGGIWRFPADPVSAPVGVLVDAVGSECLPEDDVEGMAIYPTGPESGFLIVSAQGVNRYALYERRPDADGRQPCIGSFSIGTGPTDPVGETDGIEVTAMGIEPLFPRGFLAVQDDRNEGFTRNFKFVSWQEVIEALNLDALNQGRR